MKNATKRLCKFCRKYSYMEIIAIIKRDINGKLVVDGYEDECDHCKRKQSEPINPQPK